MKTKINTSPSKGQMQMTNYSVHCSMNVTSVRAFK